MGTWGPALYSDDLAADLKSELRDLVGLGLPIEAVVQSLETEYYHSVSDPDEGPVFWLAVADAAWHLGRPHEGATQEALRIIDAGTDLARWEDPRDRTKRAAVLETVRERLERPAPAPKRVPRPDIRFNICMVGELLAYKLQSGALTLFRVIGHTTDKGGRHAVCEPLDWTGDVVPRRAPWARLRRSVNLSKEVSFSQFMLPEARNKKQPGRLFRTGLRSRPRQKPHRFAILDTPRLDGFLADEFGLR
jgi:hypothetical protein